MTIRKELCQLFDKQGRPRPNNGLDKTTILKKAILHGASHVWLWRLKNDKIEVLLQKRASSKLTWPNKYDISAAGHINDGENPLDAAIRETKEEIGIELEHEKINFVGIYQALIHVTDADLYENEFQWLYIAEIPKDLNYNLEIEEVRSLAWKPLNEVKQEVSKYPKRFVPHGETYFNIIFSAIERDRNK